MKKFFAKNKIILIVLAVLLAYISSIFIRQEIKYNEMVTEREFYMQQIEDLHVSIEDLSSLIEEISTPEYIEKMAREKLQMVKSDEIIYILEDESD
jgi:cell division protein FtsB